MPLAAEPKSSLQALHPKRVDVLLLLAASAAFLVAGLRLPVLTVRKAWEKNTFSIFSGIESLYESKYFFLAAVVFFFSIVFPLVKLAALFALWFVPFTDSQRKLILRWLEALGRWSMLDVFIVAVIIMSVKLGAFASAKPERGIYFFGLSILLAMFATAFQARLAGTQEGSK